MLNLGTWRSVGLDRILRFAWANGIRYLDTAASYGSEPAIARWLKASPEVRKQIFLVTKEHPTTQSKLIAGLDYKSSPEEVADGADAVVLVTEWKEFGELDLAALAASMRGNLFVDGRNFLDPDRTRAAGLVYEGVGRPARNGEPIPAGVE